MISAIQDLAKAAYQNYSSLRQGEGGSKLILYAPALLALGTQAIGSLPLQPVIVTIAVADAIFHCVAVRNPKFCKKAKQYEWVFYGIRLAALTWSVGHLFQTVLTAASILRTYSTYHPDSYNWWTLSWPVTIAGMIGVNRLADKIHQWIAKEKVNVKDAMPKDAHGVGVSIRHSEQPLPKAPLWIAVLQQVTYISLAIFSKSHLVFAYLSGLNLYTFYKSVLYTRAGLRQLRITLDFWKHSNNGIEQSFEYKERFAVRKNIQQEVTHELERLCQEVVNFEPFNFQPSDDGASCSMHCLAIPSLVSNPSLSKQISGRQLYMKGALYQKIECKFVPFAYQLGTKIAVQIDECDKNSKILNIPQDNGTIALFSNVLTSQILKMGTRKTTIEATVESIKVEKGQLYLLCSSIELPKAEKLAFKWNKEIREISFNLDASVYICEKGQKLAPCSKCESDSNLFYYELCEPYNALCKNCIVTDFENRVQNFTIVNEATFLTSSKIFKVWAQKEQLPEGSTLAMTAQDSCADIRWLDYQVGQKVKVQLQKVFERVATGVLPDGTHFTFSDVDLVKANEMIQAQETIEAQISLINVYNHVLGLSCISRALPPKSAEFTTTRSSQLRNGTPWKVQILIDCNPILSDQDEVCTICSNTSEMLFYNCADKTHTACIPCLTDHFKVQFSNLQILNFRPIDVRNQEGQIVCFDKESLPNCLYCRSPVVDDSRLAVWVQNMEAVVLLLDYKIDDIVQFTIHGFFQDGMPYGELNDGTLVAVTDIPSTHVLDFYLHRTPINAKILKKTVENGQLCLICGFISA
jgi:hypothetical protein